jgi:oligoendopeptidase F
MRIPHFYYNFYVFQYSTGISAAVALSQDILEEGDEAAERYIEFLKTGSSDYPLELLRTAGVDMSTADPIQRALDVYDERLEEAEQLI